MVLTRFQHDGRLDRGFGRRGRVRTRLSHYFEGYDIALQRDGRIVAAIAVAKSPPARRFGALRYLPDGRLDRSFGDGGVLVRTLLRPDSSARAVYVQEDGKVVIGGFLEADDDSVDDLGRFVLMRFFAGP